MPKSLTNYLIFIASPRGLEQERKYFKTTIDDFNTFEANPCGVHFTPVGWEDTLGGIGRPQAIINKEIEKCDYFILLLHDRWGTSPNNTENAKFTSGTEEEFYIANDFIHDTSKPMLDIVLFFKAVNERQLNDPGMELMKVLKFRAKIEDEKKFLYNTFDEPEIFKDTLRRYLAKWMRGDGGKNNQVINDNLKSPKIHSSIKHKININSKEEIESMLQEAEEFAKKGKILEAELRFSRLTVSTEEPNIMIRFARFLRKIGQIKRSLELLQKSLEKAQLVNDLINQAYAYRQMGRAQDVYGNYDAATINYEQALDIYEQENDSEGEAKTLIDLGKLLKKKGRYEDAINFIERSKLLYENCKNRAGVATALGCLGIIYKTKGNIDKAEDYHKRSLKIHEELSNKEAQAIASSNLAVIYRIKNNLSESLKLHEQALDIFKSYNDKKGIAREYSNLGVIYRLLDKNAEAKEMHQEALNISEQIGDLDGIAIQYGNLGMISKLNGDNGLAEVFYRKALSINEKIDNKVGLSIQYKNLSILCRESKDYEKSIDFINKAIDIDENTHNEYGLLVANYELAKTYLDMKMIDNALKYAESSLFYSAKLNMKDKIAQAKEIIDICKKVSHSHASK